MGVSVGWVWTISLIDYSYYRLTFPQKWWIVKVPMTNGKFCQVHLSKWNVLVLACRFELAAPSRGCEHFTNMQPSSVALTSATYDPANKLNNTETFMYSGRILLFTVTEPLNYPKWRGESWRVSATSDL